MSRSRKGTKPVGYEFNGKRPGNHNCMSYGPFEKKVSAGKVRRHAKQQIRENKE